MSQRSLDGRRGQNTAEYLLLMTLVVIPAISLLTVYSATIRAKLAMVGSSLSGDENLLKNAQDVQKLVPYEGNIRVRQKKIKVEGMDADELQYHIGR